MNFALAMGTLVLGQMINPSFDPSKPPSDQLIEQPEGGGPREFPDPQRWRPAGGRVDLPASRYGLPRNRLERPGPARQPMVPLAPTDPALSSPDSFWTTPTQGSSSSTAPGFGTRMGGSRASNLPYVRPQRMAPPTARQSPNMGMAREAMAARTESLSRPNNVARLNTKPFASFTPSSGVSPYLNMYRSSQSQVDNYQTLVRPQIQEQAQGQRFGGEIRGLQSAARLQGTALQRLGKMNQLEQGTMAPEFFNNYQTFYPVFNR